MNIDKLKNRDYYVLIDRSGSMSETDTPTGQTRFAYAQESTEAIARKLNEFDPDGITVVPFNSVHKAYPNTTPDKVRDVFSENEPLGGTMLAPPLKWAMDDYLGQRELGKAKINGAIVVVITDGKPNDEADVARVITEFTKKLPKGREEFGISLLQVGKDKGASAFLANLDDGLQAAGAAHDIVDTKTFEQLESVGLTEALLASLSD